MDAAYFKNTFRFMSPAGGAPLYVQLASYFKHQIQTGNLRPGDQVITESEMCDILGVSRTTVRLSMNRLVDEGLIVRYRRKGSFIAEPKLRRSINYMYNFTENMHELGVTPSSAVLRCCVVRAEGVVAERLGLADATTDVFLLERLRYADNNPLMLEISYIPYYLCQGIELINFEVASLYQVLANQYALNFSHAEETIAAIILERENIRRLHLPAAMAGYQIERVSYLDSGYIFEYTTSITRADKCVFKLDLCRDAASGKNKMDFGRYFSPQ